MLSVRLAKKEDLPAVDSLYAAAREFMKQSGNPTQWGDRNPERGVIEADLAAGQLYVITREERVCGVFAFILGEDPTYREIQGAWHSLGPYGTIHRLAGDGSARGLFAACLEFCRGKAEYLRVDTHQENRVMRHLAEKHGFACCGMIHVADGTPRLAYDR